VQAPAPDTQAPSAPSSLTASTKKTQISLSWKTATDNVGVTGYEVWRNGAKIASTSATSYSETPAAGTYTYSVIAYDAAGNRSAASNSVSITTKGR
jgi:chitodextrinase